MLSQPYIKEPNHLINVPYFRYGRSAYQLALVNSSGHIASFMASLAPRCALTAPNDLFVQDAASESEVEGENPEGAWEGNNKAPTLLNSNA